MRIIHIVENLDKGAVENWLVDIFILSRKLKPEWEWTFYCILGKEGRRDGDVLASGGKIIYSPFTISDSWRFLRHMRKVLKEGKYDIIHAHHDYLSGFYLLSSVFIPFRRRILHIHNNDHGLPIGNKLVHDLAIRIFGFSARCLSDIVIGISENTLSEFTMRKYPAVRDKRVLYYGINLDLVKYYPTRSDVRAELGISKQSRLVLFAGRLNEDKNPFFCVEVMRCVAEEYSDAVLLVVGEGGERPRMEQAVRDFGLQAKVFFLGWRNDVQSIMWQCDLFIFPRVEHIKEGLGLVIVEAQAAGLPLMVSEGIVPDAIVINELYHRLSLKLGSKEWASAAVCILKAAKPIERESANAIMNRSRFSLKEGCENLISIYAN